MVIKSCNINCCEQHFIKTSSIYALVLITSVILLLVMTNRSNLIYRGVYLVFPISLALVLIGLSKLEISNCQKNLFISSCSRQLHLTLLFILIYILTTIILITNNTRSITYFIGHTILGIIIFTQIIFIDNKNWSKHVIIGEIILCSLSLIWGQNIKYPLYYGSDLLVHFKLIESIMDQGFINNKMNYYKYFPLYHILGTIYTHISNTSVPRSVFILGGITYQTTLLFSYLLFKKISCEKLSLITVLILSYSRDFIYYGGYFITRSLTFSMFIIFLYLIYNSNSEKKKILQILILLAIILSHQVSMFYISLILIGLSLLEYIFVRYEKNNDRKFKINTILFFGAAFISYWVYLATNFFIYVFEAFKQSQETISASIEKTSAIASENLLSTNINNLDGSVMVFLILIGVYYGFINRNKNKDIFLLSLFGLLFLFFYVRSPLYMIPAFTKVFVAQRIALLLSPIMAFIAALGINLLLISQEHNRNQHRFLVIFFIFSLFIFSSISNSLTAQDNPILAQEKEIPTPYFSQSDLSLLNFIEKVYAENMYSDYILVRAFPLAHKLKSVEVKDDNPIVYPNSYIVVRHKELKERCLRFNTGEKSIWDKEIKYYNEKDINIEKIEEGGVIYNNKDTKIYKQ